MKKTTAPMIPVLLTELTTADGEPLAGVFVRSRRKKAALIWLHGLTSSFDRGQRLMSLMSQAGSAIGVGYFKFNTRGHHLADFRRSGKRGFVGSSYERFRDGVKDIRAMIKFAGQCGYRKIILAGHSTGASKALDYLYRTKDRRVRALLLAGPASDIAGELQKISDRTLLSRVEQAKRLARRYPDRLVPAAWGPWSAARYISLFKPGSREDVFPYHRLGGSWRALKSIRVPILMVSGGRDQYLDRPAGVIMDIYRRQARSSRAFTGRVIPNANHGFHRHQTQLVKVIAAWIRTLEL